MLVLIQLLVSESLLAVLLLSSQLIAHGLFGTLLNLGLSVLVFAELELALTLVFGDHLILLFLGLIHFFEDAVSHTIHELLLSLFPSLALFGPILLLLIKHTSILLLHSNILESFLLTFLLLDLLVLLVLGQHFHKVLLLLSLLFGGNLLLSIHLVLEALNHGHLLLKVLLSFLFSLDLIFDNLGLTHLLLLGDLVLHGLFLVLLLLVKQLEVFLLQFEVVISLLSLFKLLFLLGTSLLV